MVEFVINTWICLNVCSPFAFEIHKKQQKLIVKSVAFEIMLAGDFGMMRVAVVYHLIPSNVAGARSSSAEDDKHTTGAVAARAEDVPHEDSTVSTLADETISISFSLNSLFYLRF